MQHALNININELTCFEEFEGDVVVRFEGFGQGWVAELPHAMFGEGKRHVRGTELAGRGGESGVEASDSRWWLCDSCVKASDACVKVADLSWCVSKIASCVSRGARTGDAFLN